MREHFESRASFVQQGRFLDDKQTTVRKLSCDGSGSCLRAVESIPWNVRMNKAQPDAYAARRCGNHDSH